MHAHWYTQAVDQAALAAPTGAHYIAAHSPRRMYQFVREAFYIAAFERRPVVLGVPYDLQGEQLPPQGDYQPSATILPNTGIVLPDAAQLHELAEALLAAKSPIIVAGRGVLASGGEAAVRELADRVGAVLGNTLIARGLYDDHPFSLNVAGGFTREVGRRVAADADLVVTFGASLTHYTLDGGQLFSKALVAQVDLDPRGYRAGRKAGDIHLRGDCKATAEALLEHIGSRKPAATVRTNALAAALAGPQESDTPFEIADGSLDPREVISEIEDAMPSGYFVVEGTGHSSFFPSVMRGLDPRRHIAMREFGAIGNGLSLVIGVATVSTDGRTMLIDGDGSVLMHVQELETAQREGLKFLVVVLNDGAFGAEIHKLRRQGLDDSGAMFGRPDFASIARGFGLRGRTITKLGEMAAAFEEYESGDTAMIWDIHISDQVVSARMSTMIARGHGKP